MNSVQNREPAVAGKFYPSDPAALRCAIEEYLADSVVEAAEAMVSVLVVPHAGYTYSGRTAACAYSRISGHDFNRVILIGCSHHERFSGICLGRSGAFGTPLGSFPIDEKFVDKLAQSLPTYRETPHIPEHSLEVQLPFIAVVLGNVSIVPILLGSEFSEDHVRLGEFLDLETSEDDLVIASTDLSHFLSESEARRQDQQSLDLLLGQNVDQLVAGAADGSCQMCGVAAVATVMTYAQQRGANDWSLLDYRTSADASGETSRVVGYAALSMEHPV